MRANKVQWGSEWLWVNRTIWLADILVFIIWMVVLSHDHYIIWYLGDVMSYNSLTTLLLFKCHLNTKPFSCWTYFNYTNTGQSVFQILTIQICNEHCHLFFFRENYLTEVWALLVELCWQHHTGTIYNWYFISIKSSSTLNPRCKTHARTPNFGESGSRLKVRPQSDYQSSDV